jgi:hypothetical protein
LKSYSLEQSHPRLLLYPYKILYPSINDSQSDELQKIINAGDMEQLAMLVLNGEGKALIGKKSKQPDIQAFIDNIPTYMVSTLTN